MRTLIFLTLTACSAGSEPPLRDTGDWKATELVYATGGCINDGTTWFAQAAWRGPNDESPVWFMVDLTASPPLVEYISLIETMPLPPGAEYAREITVGLDHIHPPLEFDCDTIVPNAQAIKIGDDCFSWGPKAADPHLNAVIHSTRACQPITPGEQ